ncbi:DUF1381 domain-containing protein [Staphylococcus equorum]|uniref:DUF1381 domain-containing protein n=1 Tax=Staphylococcus equorum TaxID=246432 RepID=UPI003FD7754C
MTNYLIRHITDSTGHTFVEVIKPRDNETFTVVEAESKEEALSWYKEHKERTDWKSIDRKDSE